VDNTKSVYFFAEACVSSPAFFRSDSDFLQEMHVFYKNIKLSESLKMFLIATLKNLLF